MSKFFDLPYLARSLLIIAVYYFTGKLGLALGHVSQYATSIWAPTGIAMVVVFLGGYRYLIPVFLAAFAVNHSIGHNFFMAVMGGLGNAIEAWLATVLIRHYLPDFSIKLHRLKDVLGLIFYGALVSTLSSATIGVVSMWAFGNIPDFNFWLIWRTWWTGDMLGDLLCASLLMVWIDRGFQKIKFSQAIELVGLVASLFVTVFLVYHHGSQPSGQVYPTSYAVFPFVMWAALRFEQWGTVTIIFLVTLTTIYFTATGVGPYSNDSPERSFFFLQTFHAVISASGMILASVMMEKKRLYQQAQSAVQSREDFLTIASHELRTPITLLHMNLQRLERTVRKTFPNQSSSEVLDSIKSSKEASMHLVSLVDSLLDISNVRSGNLNLHCKPFDLCDLIRQVVHGFKEFADQHQTAFSVKLPDGELMGDWDRDRIEQVLYNLISNAIKYGDKREITIRAFEAGMDVCFSVQDQGLGIAPEMQLKVFDRFERAISYSNISGLGLGLYISRQIVEAHRGKISVESALHQGSCFTVILPKLA